jgi:DNA-binding CsgD family transcriptional regulator
MREGEPTLLSNLSRFSALAAPSRPQGTAGSTVRAVLKFGRRHRLTRAELDVLLLAVEHGLSMKEIAHRRSVNTKTIEKQWGRVYQKTGAQSQLAVLAALIHFVADDLETGDPSDGDLPHGAKHPARGILALADPPIEQESDLTSTESEGSPSEDSQER